MWVTVALAATALVTVKRARAAPEYTVDVVLRVTEGPMHVPEQLGVGALSAHVRELTFTRARLQQLVLNHPEAFPGAAKNPDGALEDLREKIDIDIATNDAIEEDDEAPRSARITLGFTGSKPETVWNVAHALADLLIDSALARERATALREQAAARSAADSAALGADDGAAPRSGSVVNRIKQTEARAAEAQLGLRAAEEQQAIRFEMVDPGRIPDRVSRTRLVSSGVVTLAISLLVACLLAGAFDPRVIDAADLVAAGVPLLGRFPSLPETRLAPAGAAQKAAAPASGDSGPRV